MSIISESIDLDLQELARSGGGLDPNGAFDREDAARSLSHVDVARAASHPLDATVSKLAASGARSNRWKSTYKLSVPLIDALVIIFAVACAQLGRFGTPSAGEVQSDSAVVGLTVYSIALALTWIVAIGLQQSWDLSLVGVGVEEYRRVIMASCWVFGIIATADLVFQLQMARGYLLIAFPVGVAGLIIGRFQVRRYVAKKRRQGKYVNHVIVLGNPDSIIALCESVDRTKSAGYSVIGACIPGFAGKTGGTLRTRSGGEVPVLGNEDAIEGVLRATCADAVAVAAVEHLGHERMRKLAWHLDELEIDMIVMPGMTDIAGPRLKTRPIDNLPLFHVARPRRDTMSRYRKRVFDLVVATVALIILSPLIVSAALAVKLDDGGPAFFRQERVGLHSKRFLIFKFRTMIVNAHLVLDSERREANQEDSVFYKSASDSRITRVGRFMRKTSIDELPQLFNVLAGTMSIVGPRPLVPGEGDSVEHFVRRRALVKPGMTGLWQVSGRSNVSAEERIRLDHSYVDNWSSIQDLLIVMRTARAVLRRNGAV